MTRTLEKIENAAKACNVNLRRNGIDLEFLRGLTKKSQQVELEKINKSVERYAKFGNADEYLGKYREQARKIGIPENEIDKYISKYQKISKDAYKKERNSCQPVDLRNELGPVRDQDSMGWCYAFALSDILSVKTKQRISASDIALSYNRSFTNDIKRNLGFTETDFQGGAFREALNKAVEKGLCLEKDFPSEDNENSNLKTNLDLIEKLRRGEARSAALECPDVRTAAKKIFPNLDMQDVRKIALTTVNKEFFQKMADATCKDRIKLNVEIESKFSAVDGDRTEVFQAIDENLDKNNPLVTAYNADVLYDKSTSSSLANHGSVIAGRRFNEAVGQCEYLIRNSWGRGCSSYDQKLTCEEGNIWVPKADLSENISQVLYAK